MPRANAGSTKNCEDTSLASLAELLTAQARGKGYGRAVDGITTHSKDCPKHSLYKKEFEKVNKQCVAADLNKQNSKPWGGEDNMMFRVATL